MRTDSLLLIELTIGETAAADGDNPNFQLQGESLHMLTQPSSGQGLVERLL